MNRAALTYKEIVARAKPVKAERLANKGAKPKMMQGDSHRYRSYLEKVQNTTIATHQLRIKRNKVKVKDA